MSLNCDPTGLIAKTVLDLSFVRRQAIIWINDVNSKFTGACLRQCVNAWLLVEW